MQSCAECGHPGERRRRNLFWRLVSRAAYSCANCKRTWHDPKALFSIFLLHTLCPLCHNRDLSKFSRPDKVDRWCRNPLRRLLALVGCHIYHCTYCRLQFRDWRSREPRVLARRLARLSGASATIGK